MKREELKKLLGESATDELIDQIMELHGKTVEKHKADIAALTSERDGLKTQLAEAGNVIDGLKKLDPEAMQKAVDEWKAKAEAAEAESQKQIGALKFEYALDAALTGAKAKNAKAVKALLNTELLKLAEDGSISGLKDQLEKIQAENDYLFESDKPDPKIVLGGNNQNSNSDTFLAAVRKGAGLPEGK